jgi:hypothetical protein
MKIEVLAVTDETRIYGVYTVYGTRIGKDDSVDFLIYATGYDWIWIPSDKCKAVEE